MGEVGHVSLSRSSIWLLGISHALSGAGLLFPVSSLLDLLTIECLLPVQTQVETWPGCKGWFSLFPPSQHVSCTEVPQGGFKARTFFQVFYICRKGSPFPTLWQEVGQSSI